MKMEKNKKGFTLAEVLITLGIIGIVAALTMPSLIANYKKMVYVTQLKKSYSQFIQALKIMSNDSGCDDDLSCTGFFEDKAYSVDVVSQEIEKHIKVLKDCGYGDKAGCMPSLINMNPFGKSPYSDNTFMYHKFLSVDGSAYAIYDESGNCNAWRGNDDIISKVCGDVYIDVNGPKEPNTAGGDVFHFYITKKANLYPYGLAWTDISGNWTGRCGDDIIYTNSNLVRGETCTGRIVEKGWKIDY